jgi:hypothetical protein
LFLLSGGVGGGGSASASRGDWNRELMGSNSGFWGWESLSEVGWSDGVFIFALRISSSYLGNGDSLEIPT